MEHAWKVFETDNGGIKNRNISSDTTGQVLEVVWNVDGSNILEC